MKEIQLAAVRTPSASVSKDKNDSLQIIQVKSHLRRICSRDSSQRLQGAKEMWERGRKELGEAWKKIPGSFLKDQLEPLIEG